MYYTLIVFFFIFFLVVFFNGGYMNKVVGNIDFYCASPYECGFCSNSLSLNSFSFTYFSLLVFFVIFDLEVSLLLNMPEQGLLFGNFYFYYLFILTLLVGFIVELLMGYVRWGV